MHVRHLILPMAGLGTRLRPLTNRRAKALVPLAGVPIMEHVLRETAGTGIEEVACVVGPERAAQFAAYIIKKAKRTFPQLAFHLILQKHPLGDGHAVLEGSKAIGLSRPCAVRFPDDIVIQTPSALRSLIDIYERTSSPVMLLQKMPQKDLSKYGIVGVRGAKRMFGGTLYRITDMVEKPVAEEAPSDLAAVGGYVITPTVIRDLKKAFAAVKEHKKDALRLVAAFRREIARGDAVYGWRFPGKRFDCGNLEGFRQAEAYVKRHT